MHSKRRNRVDLQVSVLTAVIVIFSCGLIFLLNYSISYHDMIEGLRDRVDSIYCYLQARLDFESFSALNCRADEGKPVYQESKALLEDVKNATGVRYLYTAARSQEGMLIYLVDGLPSDSVDFRHVGDPIEEEIIPDLERALSGTTVSPGTIKSTSWGHIFISYCPIYCGEQVIGVVGIEFDAQHQYETFLLLLVATPIVILAFCLIAVLIAVFLFRRISNPTFHDLASTDFLTGLKNRNAFETMLNNLKQADSQGMGFLSVDLDHLKLVNDTLGHAAGDDYIRDCAAVIQRALPKGTLLYRIGGDEFAVLCQDTSRQALEDRAAGILRAAENARREGSALELSVGWAVFEGSRDQNLFDTLKRADQQMYEQKRRKRTGGQDA